MKKILTIFIIALMGITLAACDKKNQDETFSVVFYTAGGDHIPTIFGLKKGDKIEKPEDPVDEQQDGSAREFAGWYIIEKDEEGNDLIKFWDFDVDTIEKSITLYANWEYAIYSIVYELRGGAFPEGISEELYPETYMKSSPRIFVKLKASESPRHPTKGRFIGWWKEPDLTKAQRSDSINYPQVEFIESGSSGDITLYAYYTNDD